MKLSLNKFLAIISLALYAIFALLPVEVLATQTKRPTGPIVTQKKNYKVPGAVAVSTAKRHGYRFYSVKRTKNSRRISSYDKSCEFQGMHWTTKSKKECIITGFSNSRSKCRSLRNGWRLKEIRLKGNYVWTSRPANTQTPKFRATVTNNSSKAQVLLVDYLILEGPMGPSNSWEDAFSHCSDPNY